MSLKRVYCNNPGGLKPDKFGEGFKKIVCCKRVFPKMHTSKISVGKMSVGNLNCGNVFTAPFFNASMYQARLYRFHWICFQCELVIINFWVASLIKLDDFVIFGLMSFFSFGEKFDPMNHASVRSTRNKSVSDFNGANFFFWFPMSMPKDLKNRTFCST